MGEKRTGSMERKGWAMTVLHGHMRLVPVNDSLYDTIRLWLILGLITVGLLVAVTSVIKHRQGKHRHDPQRLRAVAGEHDQDVRLDDLETRYRELVDAITEAFGEAGRELPWEAGRKPDLHVVKGGAA